MVFDFKQRDAGLDGLRGLAAVGVIAYHVLDGWHPQSKFLQHLHLISHAGSQMVAVFFVLSGYFISRSIASLQANHPHPKKTFAVRRLMRIMPLWVVSLLFLLLTHQIDSQVFFANLLFYFGDLSFQGNRWLPIIPAWTLQAEMIFYLLACVLMGTLVNLKAHKLFVIWVGVLALSTCWRSFAIHHLGLSPHFAAISFPGQCHYFFAGLYLHKLVDTAWFAQLSKQRFSFLWLMEILVIWFFWAISQPDLHLFPLALMAPLLVGLVCHPQSGLRRILSMKGFRLLGICSFGIYLLQNPSRIIAMRFFPTQEGEIVSVFAQIFVCIVLGGFAYVFIERPGIRLGQAIKFAK